VEELLFVFVGWLGAAWEGGPWCLGGGSGRVVVVGMVYMKVGLLLRSRKGKGRFKGAEGGGSE